MCIPVTHQALGKCELWSQARIRCQWLGGPCWGHHTLGTLLGSLLGSLLRSSPGISLRMPPGSSMGTRLVTSLGSLLDAFLGTSLGNVTRVLAWVIARDLTGDLKALCATSPNEPYDSIWCQGMPLRMIPGGRWWLSLCHHIGHATPFHLSISALPSPASPDTSSFSQASTSEGTPRQRRQR